MLIFSQADDWDSDPADVDLYDRDDVDWDGQYSSGRKKRSDRDIVVHIDSFTRKFRKPRMETQEEIHQRLRSVELAVKESLFAKGERHFTDNEFPPNKHSLFMDPVNPPLKLQVCLLNNLLQPCRQFFVPGCFMLFVFFCP